MNWLKKLFGGKPDSSQVANPRQEKSNGKSLLQGIEKNTLTPIDGDTEDNQFERLVHQLTSYQDETAFLNALREATSLAPKGDDLGVRALSEAIRRRCGRREISFYAPSLGNLTMRSGKEIIQAEERLIELARACRLLEDPAATQNLMSMVLTYSLDGLSGLLQSIFTIAGSEQGFDFQLLFNQMHSSIKLKHALGERSWTQQMTKDSLGGKTASPHYENARQKKSRDTQSADTVTDIDGNVYQTVTIGTQVWMAENLKVTHYRNGDSIHNVTNSTAWGNLPTGAYCNYNNDVNNVATYGRLYNKYAVNDERKLAPKGWHAPTDAEWQTLVNHLGGDAIAGGKMKEAGTTHWLSPNTGATNESGFSALPGGLRSSKGDYDGIGHGAFFGSFRGILVWARHLGYLYTEVCRFSYDEQAGFSVRCVRD